LALMLDQLLPNLNQSINGIGFLFGAGASFQAGYPLMTTLTRQIVAELTATERLDLTTVLDATGRTYDDVTATPNIEEIADLTIAHSLNSGDLRYANLERRLRDLIVQMLLSVTSPNPEHHIRFFEGLKRRTFGLPSTVWIFTTNYDVLFETAAAMAGVRLENGFSGTTTSFQDIGRFGQLHGTSDGQRFVPHPGLVVKLVKLHGSLSWYADGGQVLEQHPTSLAPKLPRTMVLPRRRKIMDTLSPPYDQLFAMASRVIGAECKYLISCGFSYGDEHINQNILLPALRASKCRLTALCGFEPSGLADFKTLPTFAGAFPTHAWSKTAQTSDTTTLWQFDQFAQAF
jgi:hypothetical protein